MKRDALIKEIAEFLGKVLPKHISHQHLSPKIEPSDLGVQTPRRPEKETVPVFPSTSSPSSDVVFETLKIVVEIKEDDDDDTDIDAEVKIFGRKHYGEIASPFFSAYLSNTRLLDTQYGIRREGDNFKIGNSTVTSDMSNITIKRKQFEGTEDLWKLLTRKIVNYDVRQKRTAKI